MALHLLHYIDLLLLDRSILHVNWLKMRNVAYIYAFSRHFYPQRIIVHLEYLYSRYASISMHDVHSNICTFLLLKTAY